MADQAPNNSEQEPVRAWRADSELRHNLELYGEPQAEPKGRVGSTKAFEARFGQAHSTRNLNERLTTNAVWKADESIRQSAIGIFAEKYPVPEGAPKGIRKAYEKAWKAMGQELVRTALFGTHQEAGESDENAKAREDLRRRELLIDTFWAAPASYKDAKKLVRGEEANLLAIKKDQGLSSPQFRKIYENDIALLRQYRENFAAAQADSMRMAFETLKDEGILDASTLASDLRNKYESALQKYATVDSLTDNQKQDKRTLESRLIRLTGLELVWKELDEDRLDHYRDTLREGLIEKIGLQEFNALRSGKSPNLDLLKARLEDAKGLVAQQRAQLLELYEEGRAEGQALEPLEFDTGSTPGESTHVKDWKKKKRAA